MGVVSICTGHSTRQSQSMSLHQVFDYFVLHCLGERFDVEGEVPPLDDTLLSPREGVWA